MIAFKKRILVVEDDPSTRKMVRFRLEHEGFSVCAVCDGVEALEKMRSEPAVDLVLLDVQMPRMDGYDLCRKLRGRPETARLPLIVMSGTASDPMRLADRCIDAGADDWICKPFRTADLMRKIHRALTRSEERSHGG